MSEDALVDLALTSSNQGAGRSVVDNLLNEPYIGYTNGGYYVKNDPDSQAKAAYRLTEHCNYTQLQVEPTYSRFEQAGGFDAYDKDDVLDDLDAW